jgi:hypothetical protein
MNIILEAVCGSIAYGLATPNSDEDLRGVFVAPTEQLLGLRKPAETVDKTNPDVCYHEVEKYMRLCLKCNPSLLEILFMDDYRILTDEGQALIDLRSAFLSNTVRHAYGGYAISQARRLNARGDGIWDSDVKNRYAKHGRHCFRLLDQGQQLLETGTLTVRVSNREELFALGELSPLEMVDKFEERFREFNSAVSILPDHPDFERVNSLLLEIRHAHL